MKCCYDVKKREQKILLFDVLTLRYDERRLVIIPFLIACVVNDIFIVVGRQQSVVSKHFVANWRRRMLFFHPVSVHITSSHHVVFISPFRTQLAFNFFITYML